MNSASNFELYDFHQRLYLFVIESEAVDINSDKHQLYMIKWSSMFPENLIVAKLARKFPAFFWNWEVYFTVHKSCCWAIY